MPAPLRRPTFGLLLLVLSAMVAVAVSTYLANRPLVTPMAIAAGQDKDQPRDERQKAPDLEGGIAWLNTAGPIKVADLKGKIVVLDFWTFCCINCLHVLDELRPLGERFADDLTVIGVHSPKFPHEAEPAAVAPGVPASGCIAAARGVRVRRPRAINCLLRRPNCFATRCAALTQLCTWPR